MFFFCSRLGRPGCPCIGVPPLITPYNCTHSWAPEGQCVTHPGYVPAQPANVSVRSQLPSRHVVFASMLSGYHCLTAIFSCKSKHGLTCNVASLCPQVAASYGGSCKKHLEPGHSNCFNLSTTPPTELPKGQRASWCDLAWVSRACHCWHVRRRRWRRKHGTLDSKLSNARSG